ncbi:MAG: lipoyl domain-containing protein [Candidatus Omnitrophica bacterium]|nr:lipoyl domain-containing protein [Candidatus Omnitrophota bacterium]MDD5670258.1 lipoyl domain-containing protein [Candidatus Omnitrophota bacterium]
MIEVTLSGLAKDQDEATIQTWFFEEGDPVEEGDNLVELITEDGVISIQATASGILAEVYYDEGELVAKGEVLCTIDDAAGKAEKEDDEDEDEEEDEDEK